MKLENLQVDNPYSYIDAEIHGAAGYDGSKYLGELLPNGKTRLRAVSGLPNTAGRIIKT